MWLIHCTCFSGWATCHTVIQKCDREAVISLKYRITVVKKYSISFITQLNAMILVIHSITHNPHLNYIYWIKTFNNHVPSSTHRIQFQILDRISIILRFFSIQIPVPYLDMSLYVFTESSSLAHFEKQQTLKYFGISKWTNYVVSFPVQFTTFLIPLV